ncbi:MAG: hypothetical protein AABW72_03755 [archaeon]
MTNHDIAVSGKMNNEQLSELLKKVAPQYSELSLDVSDVAKFANDPVFLAMLMFQLTKERERTNQLLERLEEKFDKIMLILKTKGIESSTLNTQNTQQSFEVLPEQDEKILHLAELKKRITCEEVQVELGYKGHNGASQRLNKLMKEGHLKKVKAGRKVYFVLACDADSTENQIPQ